MKKATKINKKYSHFAVHTATGKIVDGWEYSDIDKEDIKYYFKQDMRDNDYNLKEFKCIDALTLFKKGVNPYDSANWANAWELNEVPSIVAPSIVAPSIVAPSIVETTVTADKAFDESHTPVLHETITFNSPINREYSSASKMDVLSTDTESTIEVETRADGSGWFEWDVAELEITESGSLEFEGNRLVGYDGLFELPTELMDFLDSKGFITEDCR